MKTYFFVPATKISKINSIESLGVDEIIIDFEDAILQENRATYLSDILRHKRYQQYWYRIALKDRDSDTLDLAFLRQVLDSSISKFVLPKLTSASELNQVLDFINDANKDSRNIILIEHPRLLIEISSLLADNKFQSKIYGLGIGSHDLMNVLGSEHTHKQIFYPRMQVLYLAKAYSKEAIDIASMNIESIQHFQEELQFGLEYGYDAKFLVHPRQVEWFEKFGWIKERHIAWAQEILNSLPRNHSGDEIEPYILNGQIIEKPHLIKAREIIKKHKDEK